MDIVSTIKKTKTRVNQVAYPILSEEQKYFVEKALEGNNILVDACIGSGKTTSIQYLCEQISEDKRILYLTYNKLLKLDAKKKIKNKTTTVTNYHGFAYGILRRCGVIPGYADSVQLFVKGEYPIPHYDVLIIDEYQDIEQELAELLEYVKKKNPGIQIIAVGDMAQKIYDKTTLNVPIFINKFLGSHIEIEFTNCFRLSSELADLLGRVWKKKIKGVNKNCQVDYMTVNEAAVFLKEQNPKDILCLGATHGKMTDVLNSLEADYPDVFNKKTVFAKIRETDGGSTEPTSKSAIFTTFDSSKGMERSICMVFDWTYDYWMSRIRMPGTSYPILRNIFCVAASRGKQHIVFVSDNEDDLITEEELETDISGRETDGFISIEDMFDFKYKEDIENAYSFLRIEQKGINDSDNSDIQMRDHDELIDLIPCIEKYQLASYFTKYDIDKDIEQFFEINNDKKIKSDVSVHNLSLDEKILYLVSLQTKHNRYRTQVTLPLVDDYNRDRLHNRLSLLLNQNENVQIKSNIPFYNADGSLLFEAVGFADVMQEKTLYEIRYIQEFSHEHFLICASYMIAQNANRAFLWNTRDNRIYSVSIPDKQAFMDAVTTTITKGKLKKYYSEKGRDNVII